MLERDLVWPTRFEQFRLATGRQRTSTRLMIAANATAELGWYEALGATLAAIGAKLREIWPESEREMPLYPAFR